MQYRVYNNNDMANQMGNQTNQNPKEKEEWKKEKLL